MFDATRPALLSCPPPAHPFLTLAVGDSHNHKLGLGSHHAIISVPIINNLQPNIIKLQVSRIICRWPRCNTKDLADNISILLRSAYNDFQLRFRGGHSHKLRRKEQESASYNIPSLSPASKLTEMGREVSYTGSQVVETNPAIRHLRRRKNKLLNAVSRLIPDL